MRKGDRKPNMEKLAGIAKTLLDNRVFLITVISACVVIMIISAASIVRSLIIMHENAPPDTLLKREFRRAGEKLLPPQGHFPASFETISTPALDKDGPKWL